MVITPENLEAFWTGVYMAALPLMFISAWVMVCAILNRSLS